MNVTQRARHLGDHSGEQRRGQRLRPHRLERGVGLRDRHAGAKAAHDVQPEPARLHQRVPFIAPQTREHRHRDGDVRRHPDRDPEEAGRGDADDGERLPFDAKRATDRRRIPVETALPGGVAEHRYRLRLRRGIPDVGLIEQAARCRPKAERVVKRPRHEQHRGRLGLARPVGMQRALLPREQTPEHVPAIADLLEDWIGERRIPQPDQFLRRLNRAGAAARPRRPA